MKVSLLLQLTYYSSLNSEITIVIMLKVAFLTK